MKPLVTVILPTYNRANMLSRAIKSVLDQEYKNIELLVVDDASEDNTKEVVGSFVDSRIKYICLEKNSGGAATPRNVGLKQAKGEFIVFLDSDDEFLSERISKLVQLMETLKPEPCLVFSNSVIDGPNELNISKNVSSGFVDSKNSFPASVFCPPSCWMLRKSMIENEYFDEKIWVIEDCDFFARLVRKFPVYFHNEPLVRKYVHGDLAGSVPIEYAQQTRERMLDKWQFEMEKDKKYITDFYCTMAKDLIKTGKKDKALNVLSKALKINPLNMRIWGKFLKACLSKG